jgi:hypothetical protein
MKSKILIVLAVVAFIVGYVIIKKSNAVTYPYNAVASVKGMSCGTSATSIGYMFLHRSSVIIQNQDTTNATYIGFDVEVSTVPGDAHAGYKLSAGGSLTLEVPSTVNIYCKGSNTVNISVTEIAKAI